MFPDLIGNCLNNAFSLRVGGLLNSFNFLLSKYLNWLISLLIILAGNFGNFISSRIFIARAKDS